jgi:hypothetical protein
MSASIRHLDELSELWNKLLTFALMLKSLLLFSYLETNSWESVTQTSMHILLSRFGTTAASTERNEAIVFTNEGLFGHPLANSVTSGWYFLLFQLFRTNKRAHTVCRQKKQLRAMLKA